MGQREHQFQRYKAIQNIKAHCAVPGGTGVTAREHGYLRWN